MELDPRSAALYALVAIAFVLVGAVLVVDEVGVEPRAALLGAIATVLLAIGLRIRSSTP